MIKNATLGQYFPGDSFIHRMDPRAKMLVSLCMIVIIFVYRTWIGYAAVLALIALTLLVARISPVYVLKAIKPLWFILVVTFAINVFFFNGETVLVSWWKVKITVEGLKKAAEITARLVLLVSSSMILTLTTSPMELTSALENVFSPLAKIRFPVYEISLMISIALRFIPTLMEETDKIMKAQTARGATFDSGGLVSRAKGLVPILVPLFVSAFRRADELALAMESRCYNGGEGRTRYRVLRFKPSDLWAVAACAALITVAAFGF